MAGNATKKCPQVNDCPMFGMFTLSGTLRIWQDNYCHGDFQRCERYVRSQRGEAVPKTLMPNGKTLTVPTKPAG